MPPRAPLPSPGVGSMCAPLVPSQPPRSGVTAWSSAEASAPTRCIPSNWPRRRSLELPHYGRWPYDDHAGRRRGDVQHRELHARGGRRCHRPAALESLAGRSPTCATGGVEGPGGHGLAGDQGPHETGGWEMLTVPFTRLLCGGERTAQQQSVHAHPKRIPPAVTRRGIVTGLRPAGVEVYRQVGHRLRCYLYPLTRLSAECITPQTLTMKSVCT